MGIARLQGEGYVRRSEMQSKDSKMSDDVYEKHSF